MAIRTLILLALSLQVTWCTPLKMGLNIGGKSENEGSSSSKGIESGFGVEANIGRLGGGIGVGFGSGTVGSGIGSGIIGSGVKSVLGGGTSASTSFGKEGGTGRAGGEQGSLGMGHNSGLSLSSSASGGLRGGEGEISRVGGLQGSLEIDGNSGLSLSKSGSGGSSGGITVTGEDGIIGRGGVLKGSLGIDNNNRLSLSRVGSSSTSSGSSGGASSFISGGSSGNSVTGEVGTSRTGGLKGSLGMDFGKLGQSGSGSVEGGKNGNLEISRQLGLSINGNTDSNYQGEERSSDDGISTNSEAVSGGNLKIDGGKGSNEGDGLTENANMETSVEGSGASFGTGIHLGPLGSYSGNMNLGKTGLTSSSELDLGQLVSLAASLGGSGESTNSNGFEFNGNLNLGGQGSGEASMGGNLDLERLLSLQSSLGGTGGGLNVNADLGGSGGAGISFLPITSHVLNRAGQLGRVPLHFLSSGFSGAANALGNMRSSGASGANLNVNVPSPVGYLGLRQLIPKFNARILGNTGGEGSTGSSVGLEANGNILGSSRFGSGSGTSGSFGLGGGPISGMLKGGGGGIRVIKGGENKNGMKVNLGSRLNQSGEISGNLNSNMQAGGNVRTSLKLPSLSVSVGSKSASDADKKHD